MCSSFAFLREIVFDHLLKSLFAFKINMCSTEDGGFIEPMKSSPHFSKWDRQSNWF